MNILVGVSQVPDTTAKIVVASDGTQIDKTGVKFICNPYDEYAIEEGLRLREKHGGTVTVVSCGPDGAKEVLRTALAMGADKAILVKDDAKNNAFGVASSLASVARSIQADLVIVGRQSIDYDSFQMAPTVAEILDQPSISMVSKLDINGTNVSAERDIEGGKESVETSLPCVISVQKGINDPRYPKLPDIMKAKSKPIEEVSPAASEVRVKTVAMEIPSNKRRQTVLGSEDADIAEFVRLLHEEAKAF